MKKFIFAVMVVLFCSQAYSQVEDTLSSKPSTSHKKVIQQVKQAAVVKAALPPASKASLGFVKAASMANYDMMDLYLQQGADINCLNCKEYEQRTALFRALAAKDFQLADWLIQRGADINITTTYSQTTDISIAMFAANSNNHQILAYPSLPILDYLIRNGADIKSIDSTGRNALHYILGWEYIGSKNNADISKMYVAFIDQLTTHGVDVNQQDRSGATTLMNAANSCSPASIKLLLSYGADPALQDKLGKSALDIAMERATQSSQNSGCNQVVKILMDPQKATQSPSIQPEGVANSRQADEQKSVASYAGTYGGTFKGNDEGIFQAVIVQDGTATLSGHSNHYGVTFTGAGKVSDDGAIALGSVSTGSEFIGNISRGGVMTGTWKNAPQKLAGSFQGGKDVQVSIPPTDSLKVLGSMFGGLLAPKH